ncbi:hypothetical protein J5N97_028213 [Dioscorea zingiberensis]|uniref:Uncharacterized protein n=1 Tax=Dioscorea zingiberensis TaxID=325984 RepID=A0A9D5H4N6_9LILI|nr:hypothetical protein J5N97_028213 [Dioscorea zingiberensis]
MGEAPANHHLTKVEPSIPQKSGWIVKTMQIGGEIAQRLAVSGPLIFSCICLAIAYKNRKSRVLHRSVSMAALHGGNVALQRILVSTEARVDKDAAETALQEFKELLSAEKISFTQLHKVAAKLEMTRQEDEAVRMLREASNKARKDGKPHESYELEMLLVEMLIFKGTYYEALTRRCLEENTISDSRRPLYKAVVYKILLDDDRAQEAYNEFCEIRSLFYSTTDNIEEGAQLYGSVHKYETFEKVVGNLKREIENAHPINRTENLHLGKTKQVFGYRKNGK